ncbi:TonB-dependent receptor [Sphingobacterium sp. SRCM116780]|uniref:TonB-dependent receptor n=1 Tax=Sphingobacterium sp. SRCM116780 TaxID=2907623 RepID=UPI001F1D8167|nr:TonB-dependent receptor [Sphingobacterium sp. SRCM116780]UIR55799.1 TonB-dependent receptor [Sphingobacterium sp. SRCM116780]
MKFILFLLLYCSLHAVAQTQIHGQVIDKNKKAVRYANIFIEGTYDGGTTDSLGNFVFETTESGIKILKFTAIGRESKSITIDLSQNKPILIQLDELAKQLDEVVIQAGLLQAGDNGKNTVMTPLDIVSTAGSMGNIFGALATLPGAQVAGENGRLMVHGGNASETQTYINGIRVAQPYSSSPNDVPVRGRFSPFLFKGVNFSTGGYSAEYGNALSSVLILNTPNQIEENKSEISISSVGLGLSNTQNWKTKSLTFNTSYTNLKPYSKIITPNIDWTKPYENASGELIYRQKLNTGFISMYTSFNFEDMGLYQANSNYAKPILVKKTAKNIYWNTNYEQQLGNRWNLQSGIGLGYLNDKLYADSMGMPHQETALHIKEKLNKSWNNKLKSTLGIDYFFTNYKQDFINPSATKTFQLQSSVVAAYTETTYALTKKVIAKLGLRGTKSNEQSFIVEPRASIGYLMNPHSQFSFAYGDFHQQGPQEVLIYDPHLKWSEAQHYILNYYYEKNGRTLRLETYRKNYNNLIKYTTRTITNETNFNNQGEGYAQGLDVFLRDNKSIKNLQYWISYAFTDTKRNEGDAPLSVVPSYVFRHTFSVVAKYWINSLHSQISLTDNYLSGRSFDDRNQASYMQGKTKGYNMLSGSWSYLISPQKIIHFSISNILGSSPIYGYQYAEQPNQQGIYNRLAITPTAKRFIFVGFFWTISSNKKENQLDNL